MGDSSHVDIDALADFGKSFMDMLKDKDQSTKMTDAFKKMAKAKPGMSGTNEAQTFADWYSEAVYPSLTGFSEDCSKGVPCLMNGIIVQAANYRHGDISQAEAFNDLLDTFNPAPGTDSVGGEWDKYKKEHAHDDQVDPSKVEDKLKAAQSTDPFQDPSNNYGNSCEDNPETKWKNHFDTYGKDERWHPDGPNGYEKPKIKMM